MDYKDTLLMPDTAFEMRGNLPKKEPGIAEEWEKSRLYDRMIANNAGKPFWMLHDGPPYANNNLHMGTAMNRILKDFIVKSKNMGGYQAPFYPGWDTHGLPIENMMPKIGINRKQMSTSAFRAECEKYALKQVDIQKATEKRLGTLADFDHPYITLQKHYEAMQIRTFGQMAVKGLIYQGLKPIYWSPERESAVADSETYYETKKDQTIYVAFSVADGHGVLDGDEKFVIWTTTPWTIPANLAICLNPDYEYAVVETAKGKLIVLKKLVEQLMAKFELADYKILKTFKGRQLEYVTVKHPLYERTSLVILGNHVTDQDGTGCVHTAPGHGMDDFIVGQKYGLPAYCPVDEKGCMMAAAGAFIEGKSVWEANPLVIAKLDELGVLLKQETIEHQYAFDERMKKPVIYRATVQWFASIDKIRDGLLNEIDKIHWENEWGNLRLHNMIHDRADWCISRQRVWGVPIPIFYGEDKKPIIDQQLFDHVADLFEEFGSNVWFDREAKDLLPDGYTNPASPNGRFTKENDIMDVWFDSGSSHNTFAERGYPYPCDLYFEGSDQYRGWFNSSLVVGYATHGSAPYRSVLSHGYVLDGHGRPMHKSAGNVVDPSEVISRYGADVIRLWCACADFKQDVRCSDDVMKQTSDFYRKIRNTFRFLLGNISCSDYNDETDAVPFEKLSFVDKYILAVESQTVSRVRKDYEKYDFLDIFMTLNNFMVNELSSFYMDYAKDILYCSSRQSVSRRQIQTVFYKICDDLVRLWAPILSFTCEEIYHVFKPEAGSIFLTQMPQAAEIDDAAAIIQQGSQLMQLRNDVLKELELKRNAGEIGKALEAKVSLVLNDDNKYLETVLSASQMANIMIVSQLAYQQTDNMTEYPTCHIRIDKAEGHVCSRCWQIVETVDENGLCQRCSDVISERK